MRLLCCCLRRPRIMACNMQTSACTCPPLPTPLQYEGEIHVTIIATGFSQTFEENLWGGGKSQVKAGATPGSNGQSQAGSAGAQQPGSNGWPAPAPTPAAQPAAQPQRRAWW